MQAASETFTKPDPAVKPGDLAVVVGAGVSGVAAARLLHRMGARVRLLDRSRERIPADFAAWAAGEGVEIVCGEHAPEHFAGARLVVPSPGVAAAVIRKFLPAEDAPDIMAETELAWRQLSGEPVIGVTGTSGKTTTTSLCSAMLREQGLRVFTGGNIGTPLSEYVLSGERADVVVLELSSFQLQTCSLLRPRVAILLNISENHLDFHKDMEEYVSAKMRLFANQTAEDVAILQEGMDDLAHRYGLAARIEHYAVTERFPDMQLMGPHNRANAEAAWLACREFGVSEEAAARAVATGWKRSRRSGACSTSTIPNAPRWKPCAWPWPPLNVPSSCWPGASSRAGICPACARCSKSTPAAWLSSGPAGNVSSPHGGTPCP